MPHDPDHDDNVYLWDMRRALGELAEITRDQSLDDLLGSRLLQLAVERAIEIVGEAARKVSDQTRADHPGINWVGIIAQRNVIAHQYEGIDYGKLWRIITVHAAQLRSQLDSIIPEPPPDPLPEEPDR